MSSVLLSGRLPEWPKGADCKSAGVSLRWFDPSAAHAPLAQLVEHVLGKDEVVGSIPMGGFFILYFLKKL